MSAHVVEAVLELAPGADPAAVGAAVTLELCGAWSHAGPCRWPHNNAIDGASFRTLYVAPDQEADAVAARIEAALRGSASWRVVSVRRRQVTPHERELAARLARRPV